MKHKLWVTFLTLASALCLIVGLGMLSACGMSSKAEKIKIGDSPARVVKLLGDPDAEDSTETHYVYYGKNYLKLREKSAKLESQAENIQNLNDLEKLFEEIGKLEAKYEALIYKYTEVHFSKNEAGYLSVSSVYYDAACGENAPEKEVKEETLIYGKNYTYRDVINGEIKNFNELTTYTDGSYRMSASEIVPDSFSINGSFVEWRWTKNGKEFSEETTIKGNLPNGIIFEGVYGSNETTVRISEGVKNIPDLAFLDMGFITEITIPESVKKIGKAAFEGCSQLTIVNISNISAWCNISFSEASYLYVNEESGSRYYTIVSNPLYYSEKLCLNGELITDLEIPDGVKKIGNRAFDHCKSLTNVTIPNSVTKIGKNAFSGCTNLSSITIGNGVEKIESSAFAHSRVTHITFQGTTKEWKKIKKAQGWRVWSDIKYVVCTDGTLMGDQID